MTLFDAETDKFTLYSKIHGNLANDYVLCILHDRKGQTWVGTNSGLSMFDNKNKRFRTFTNAQGLSAQTTIYKLVEDKNGTICSPLTMV